MKRITAGLLALCLSWMLPVTAAALDRAPILSCQDSGESIQLTLENLEGKIYALQVELILSGTCPDAAFTCEAAGAYSPDCRVQAYEGETVVTLYVCAQDGVLNSGKNLRLGVLKPGARCGMPEQASLILLDRDLNTLDTSGKVDVTTEDRREEEHRVRVTAAEHGKLEISPNFAIEGERVTVSAVPDPGYTLKRLTAADSRGREIRLTEAGDNRYTFTMPDYDVSLEASFISSGSSTPAPGQNTAGTAGTALPFTDISLSDWCYDAVRYVYEAGLMNGTSATAFTPNQTTTRGMIVAILYRMEGSPTSGPSNFTDVAPGAYYASAVAWASANGIVNGYSDGTFRPGNRITREQMAAFLYRYARYKGRDVSARADLSRYPDAGQLAGYAVEPMQWANAQGLINGTSAGTISPAGNATRAQVAVILSRFAQNASQILG